MGRSAFIFPSKKKQFERAQYSRFKIAAREIPLEEGPFADHLGSARKFAKEARGRINGHSIKDKVTELGDIILAEKIKDPAMKKIKIRTIKDLLTHQQKIDSLDRFLIRTAGRMAFSPNQIEKSADATTLLIGMLRRMKDSDIFMGYAHVKGDYAHVKGDSHYKERLIPSIISYEGGELFSINSAGTKGIIEVLDDEAFLSILYFDIADEMISELPNDIPNEYFPGTIEELMRAASIGHAIHKGKQLWSMEKVRESECWVEDIRGDGFGHLKSVREYSEEFFSDANNPSNRMEIAENMLCEKANKELSFSHPDFNKQSIIEKVEAIYETSIRHKSAQNAHKYLRIMGAVSRHEHPAEECPLLRVLN